MSKRTHSEALQTKKNILSAAQKLFIQKGFSKTSLSDIAREAHVTRGAIYWHFENKNELLAALCVEGAQDINIVSMLRAAGDENQRDPLGCLKQWTLLHFTDDAEVMFNSVIIDIFDSVLASDSVKPEMNDAREKLLDLVKMRKFRVEEALRGAVRQMQLPPDVDIELAASMLMGLLNGFVSLLRQGLAVRPFSRYHQIVEQVFHQLPNIKRRSTYTPSNNSSSGPASRGYSSAYTSLVGHDFR